MYHDGVGAPGTFTFSPNPNDTVPDTDVVKYRYTFSGETTKEVANSTAGGPASVTWTPSRSGPHWVDVVAVDKAAHPSATARHSFYVAAGAAAAAQWNLADEAGGNAADEEQGKYPAGFGPGVTFGVPGPGGTIDRAARFDGTADSWIDAGSTVLDTLKGFSVSAWVRPTDLSRDMTVVSQDGTGEPGFVLGYDAMAKTWKFSVPTGDVDSLGEWKAVSTGVTPVKDQWVLLTGIYDGATGKIQLYVDKDLKGETVRRSTWKSYGALQIGRHIDKAGYEDAFVGDLAEVRVFSRPLLPAQITDIKTVRPERKGYWQLNTVQSGASPEAGGGQGLTMAGNAAIYLPNPDPLADPPPVDAMVGTGHLLLDGNGDYVSTAAAPVTGAASFTLSARVQISSLEATASQTVFSLPGANANRVQVRYQAATKRWELAVATTDTAGAVVKTFSENQVLPDNNPVGQHLAVVYDAFDGQIRLYVNGQLAAAQGVDNTTWAATGGLQVGRSLRGNAEYFAGGIDEVRAYNGALDPISVEQLAGTVELAES